MAWIAFALPAAAFALLQLCERRWPLRRTVEPKGRRVARNVAMLALAAGALALVHRSVVPPLAARADRRRLGLLRQLPLPRALEVVLGVLLLDYTLWWWHRLNHRVPFLWRFHATHHMDRDLDASTGLRFHFGEMTLSVGWRAAQVLLIGASGEAFAAWQLLLGLSILHHHANVALPPHVDRLLVRLLVTPRMHGIHHSIVPGESNANYASLLTIWDRLHRTLVLDVPQQEITIGIPSHQEPEQVTLGRIVAAPFVEPVPRWLLPDGEVPTRARA